MSAQSKAERHRQRMADLLSTVRQNIKRSDKTCKISWAARGVTNYQAQIKEWKSKGIRVAFDHPFYRFIREEQTVEHPFYRFIRMIAHEGSERKTLNVWRIFGTH